MTLRDKCWLWAGTIGNDGYGQINDLIDGKRTTLRAHRVIYENTIGQIPQGLVTDHLCRIHACVNPEHLELVTIAENVRRGYALQTHCKQGHKFTVGNTYITKHGHRKCKTCSKKWRDNYRKTVELVKT